MPASYWRNFASCQPVSGAILHHASQLLAQFCIMPARYWRNFASCQPVNGAILHHASQLLAQFVSGLSQR